MKYKKIYEDLTPLKKRAQRTFILVKIIFVILLISFWKTQILDHDKYWKQSEANRIREIALSPQRGLIKDRNGSILAKNIASYTVSLIRENCTDYEESCRRIAQLLHLEPEVLKQRINKYKSLPLFHPIVIKDNLELKEVSRIKARMREFPELVIQSEPKRSYPHGTLAAHVIGYLQEISQQDLKRKSHTNRRPGDLVGKTGIEKEFDSELAGQPGHILEVVDSTGRERGEMWRENPVPGNDVTLTLDFALQKKAEELLEGREGAAVVLHVKSGEILALASYPTFDPNKFINRFSPKEWLDLMSSSEFPLENRAVRGLYAPGSVFKPVLALGSLESGLINEKKTFYCSGATRIYGHPFSCWFKGGHGTVNMYSGIQHSCNIYFYQVGKIMGIEEIAGYARMLGFGAKTGLDIPGEKKGLVPDPEWKRTTRKEPWYPGETISVSIGQGPLMVTPVQVAAYTALIANRGKKITPHLYKSETWNGQNHNEIDISSSSFEKVIYGMWKVVNEQGTGRAAKVRGFDVCGKTGSTQVISSSLEKELKEEGKLVKSHSWFTGFAPRENPQLVVTILVEYGGMGGATAAPLSRQLFSLYKERYDQ